jgi:hypothetical protein
MHASAPIFLEIFLPPYAQKSPYTHVGACARTHARTLKVCILWVILTMVLKYVWYTIPTQGRNHRENFGATKPIVGRLFSCSAFLLYYICSVAFQPEMAPNVHLVYTVWLCLGLLSCDRSYFGNE